MALTDAIHKVSRSLAFLSVDRPEGRHYGTAFVVRSSGEILTSAHLLRDASHIEVKVLGSKVASPCEVIDTDARADVALLKAAARDLTPAALYLGGNVAIGREVAFLGFPHADIFEESPLVMPMRGIVGNRYRLGQVEYYIVDASPAEGMSGGPLFLADTGEVVGLVGSRFDPGRTRAKLRGAAPESIRDLPNERTNIMFAPAIDYALALLRKRS